MQHRQEAKVEYRHRDEYRESFFLRQGLMNASGDAIIAICVLIAVLVAIAWLFWNWLITVAFANQPVLTIIGALIALSPIAWKAKVAIDKHNLHVKRELAEIGALNTSANIMQLNAHKYGFNAEYVNGSLALRSTDPSTGSTHNHYEVEEENEGDEPLQIEGPKMVTLSELLADGSIQPREETSLIGFERADGSRLRGKLFAKTGNMFNSLFVVGDPDFGKSTMGTYLGVLTVMQGGKIIVIDPQAELEHSLTDRLGPLAKPPFCISHAGTPEEAKGAIQIARQELSQPGDYPVLLLIDEFSELQSGFGEWADIGPEVVAVAESFARTGRKLKRRTVVFGQISTAKRTGGTEFRNVCSTVAFHLKVQSAQNVLDEFDKLIAPTLAQGEIVLVPALQQSHTLRLPYPDKDGLTRVAEMMSREITREAITKPVEPFHSVSELSPDDQDTEEITDDTEPLGMLESAVNEAVKPCESIPQFSPDEERQIIDIARVQVILDGKVTRAKIPAAMNPPRNNKFYPVVKYICDREGF